jgi:hypothetical protein
MMSQKAFFEMLGAPLHSHVWSWGAIRKSDGIVFLRVWKDQIESHDGANFVRILSAPRNTQSATKPGRKERVEHIDRIRKGASCYLVVCEAHPDFDRPRRIGSFNRKHVFSAGVLQEFDGNCYIQMLDAVAVEEVLPPT